MYCYLCGEPAIEGACICTTHEPVYFAIHDFVATWRPALPLEVGNAILKSPYLYNPETGKRYTEEEEG